MATIFAIVVLIFGLFGMNFIFWSSIGILRIIDTRLHPLSSRFPIENRIQKSEIAIIIPAHNEELVVANTIKGALRVLPKENIHIITSDFPKKDRTADIARSFGVNVLELPPPLAKATKLQTAIKYFDFAHTYKGVLFVDADTILSPDFLDNALPLLDDPEVVAVAGHASTLWEPEKNSWLNMFILSYRERVYFFGQLFIKFGQSWRFINTCPIVPGFASIYRSSVLPLINIDPGGLVIEDFNMTFEVQHGNLGKIVYSPKVIAYTQDPDNLKDYFKQIKRWNLGFWQTVFRHGYWTSTFWLSLAFYMFEVTFSTIIFLLLPLYVLLIFLAFGIHPPYQYALMLCALLLIDYVLTVVIAAVERRPQYLFYGLGFVFMRFVDALAYIYSIPKAIFATSSGAWASPTRR